MASIKDSWLFHSFETSNIEFVYTRSVSPTVFLITAFIHCIQRFCRHRVGVDSPWRCRVDFYRSWYKSSHHDHDYAQIVTKHAHQTTPVASHSSSDLCSLYSRSTIRESTIGSRVPVQPKNQQHQTLKKQRHQNNNGDNWTAEGVSVDNEQPRHTHALHMVDRTGTYLISCINNKIKNNKERMEPTYQNKRPRTLQQTLADFNVSIGRSTS